MSESEEEFIIMAVDDDPQALEILEAFLESQGHVIYKAENGKDAIKMLDTYSFDLIISDVMMPKMDGFELCQEIKSREDSYLIPVVMVTALGEKEHRIKGIEAGCDDFFTKPFDKLELRARVQSLGKLKRSIENLENAELVLSTLANSVESRDDITGNHCERLRQLGISFGIYLDMERTEIQTMSRAGTLHDIGKISVPDAILNKPGPLDEYEWKIIKEHTVKGEEILRPLKTVQNVIPIVRHHHERWDGEGYPDGLKGEKIPYLARVFQVLDIYDALTSKRPYKEPMPKSKALEILKEESEEEKRDPRLTEKFIDFIEGEEK